VTIRLYIDEDAMDRDLLRALRARGVDVVAANEVGMVHRPDEEHLAYAASEGRVIYTFNVGDFCRLHGEWMAAGQDHAGIIVARQQSYSVGEQMRRVLNLMAARSADDMRNRLEFLSDWS
jgi:uncharacterized protein with PIN domain